MQGKKKICAIFTTVILFLSGFIYVTRFDVREGLLYRILIIEKCQKRYLSARSNKANRVRINVNFNSCEAYVVKFKAKLKEFEYYTFYDSKTEYEEDKQANLIMLRKQLVSRALKSMMGNSTSEIYAYMKPNTVIIPENIIKYVSAKEWRKKCT